MSRSLSIAQTFAALKHYNYRLWFLGQLTSMVGTWMQATAQGYLVYELTKNSTDPLTSSAAYLGYVGFASGAPTWLFTLYAGSVADRISRRTLLIITQSSMMILAFILGILVFTGLIQPWHIVVMAFLLGIANAFDAPARLAFVAELVGREDLTNAVALNATMFNMATIVGPVVAAMAYDAYGPAWCFTINGISFIALIAALSLMRIQPIAIPNRRSSSLAGILEGLRYVRSQPIVNNIVGNLMIATVFGFGLFTLMPKWAAEVLNGDERTFGLLLTSRGSGAVVGALLLAALGATSLRGKLWGISGFVFPLGIIAFSLSRSTPFSMVIMAVLGWSWIWLANISNAMVQNLVPDELRGRVMGIYSLAFFGFMPIGSMIAGQMAARISMPTATLSNAIILGLFTLFIALRRPQMRSLT